MSPAKGASRWVRPEVYPLFAAIGAAVGLCGFAMARNLFVNPDVRINKNDRAAGYLENYKEGENYHGHTLRKFVEDRPPQIFTAFNGDSSAAKPSS